MTLGRRLARQDLPVPCPYTRPLAWLTGADGTLSQPLSHPLSQRVKNAQRTVRTIDCSVPHVSTEKSTLELESIIHAPAPPHGNPLQYTLSLVAEGVWRQVHSTRQRDRDHQITWLLRCFVH